MSYNLSTTLLDQVSHTGTLLDGRKWAHVYYGVWNGLGTQPTSADLLTGMDSRFHGQVDPLMVSTVLTTAVKCRQLNGWRVKYGTQAVVVPTVIAGVVTALTVINGGSGYNASPGYTTLDPAGGSGATFGFIVSGGAIISGTVYTGGTGYSTGLQIVPAMPDGASVYPNRRKPIFASADSKIVARTGGVGTDELPNFNAFSIQMRNGLPGRYGRQSAHWPGVPEASTTGNKLQGGVITSATAAAVVMYTTPFVFFAGAGFWTTRGVSQSYLFFYSANNAGAGYLSSSATTTAFANPIIGVMRRRKSK